MPCWGCEWVGLGGYFQLVIHMGNKERKGSTAVAKAFKKFVMVVVYPLFLFLLRCSCCFLWEEREGGEVAGRDVPSSILSCAFAITFAFAHPIQPPCLS